MPHILGCTSQMPDAWKAPELIMPTHFPDGRHGAASLIRVTWRALYYRETILPTSARRRQDASEAPPTFDPRQE